MFRLARRIQDHAVTICDRMSRRQRIDVEGKRFVLLPETEYNR